MNKPMNNCDTCNGGLVMKGDEIVNGHCLVYKQDDKTFTVLRCKDCYKKNKSLTNYRDCEVYSRIVGYLRPVSQWNVGKKAEFKDRKTYGLKQ